MSTALVTVRTFNSRMEAELAKSLLDAHDIPSFVSADDAGGMRPPPFQFAPGARLVVRTVDLLRARRLLEDIE